MSARNRPLLQLDPAAAEGIVDAALDDSPISGLTHNFYRYPARFSPTLVRATIKAFTKPGDLVLDPFVGGGTSLVEALAAGRHAIGTDISELAAFVSEVKTMVCTEAQLRSLRRWAGRVVSDIDMAADEERDTSCEEAGYLRHLHGSHTWRMRKAIAQALTSAKRLRDLGAQKFARCAVLRTAQWALDGRKVLPSIGKFRHTLREHTFDMLAGSAELAAASEYYNYHRPHGALDGQTPYERLLAKMRAGVSPA
jgi:hypothetical protein